MRIVVALFAVLLIAGCATYYSRVQWDELYGKADPGRFDHVQSRISPIDYGRDVKPVLDSRCVVCHACYDAPCQLQLGSYEGVTRGANKDLVYDSARLLAAAPTRLYQDASSNAGWRNLNFFPVLNERQASKKANIQAGVMARLLSLKRKLDFPQGGILPEDRFDFGLDRDQQCAAIEEIDQFEGDHPEWGMPYGFPPLSKRENRTLMKWLEAGAPSSPERSLTLAQRERIDAWEAFLNGEDLKSRLMSRYIYEHWYLAHLYFDELPPGDYFELVRSRTPPGQPIDLIAARRPYDDPGVERVYYRLRRHLSTLVAKTHMPYALNPARMKRIQGWFLDEAYSVTELPSYEPRVAANPFIAFAQLPVRSRYRLLLDEAMFTVMGFIKGPVCRGQVALNVISDYFWIGFVAPDLPEINENSAFLAEVLRSVSLPSEQQSNALLIKWLTYSREENEYLHRKSAFMNEQFKGKSRPTLSLLWDGDGVNRNAALTIFRHFDSASVVQGLLGDRPQTVLIMGYPLLERIHYLLVAGFDVYGNTAHQLEARLYMDFLRMEGEMVFLAFLPLDDRNTVRDFWYRGAPDDVKAYLNGSKAHFSQETGIEYKSSDPPGEFYGLWKAYLSKVLDRRYDSGADAPAGVDPALLRTLATLRGRAVSYLPETSFLTIRAADGRDHHYTLIRNSAHSNISELFSEEDRRLPNEDTLTLVRGFLGAYPNAFYRVPADRLESFIKGVAGLETEEDYAMLADHFAIRRTNPGFWAYNDSLNEAYRRIDPVEAGLFDLNRFENR
ncbi:MAG: fatty acid cis/trans isomerase [Gammaproteobacteria bacterium]